jgi:hypothetical protein
MTIIKKKNIREWDKKDVSFIGINLPKEEASFLYLFCLAKGITKTSVLSDLIHSWVVTKQNDYTKDSLIDIIAKNIYKVYLSLPPQKKNFMYFRNKLRQEFELKEIEQSIVDAIIKSVSDEKEKDKPSTIE